MPNNDREIFNFLKDIFPICRSITGQGNRETLKKINEQVPIKIYEEKTGYRAYDWKVPQEWNVKDAYVADENGNKIIDFKKNNLHLVSYSINLNQVIDETELQKHIYSIENNPDAIPYITSYYKKTWGFCMRDKDRKKIKKGKYHVFIDAEHKDGSLSYGELILPGREKKEVLLSTYICHPSMANNECSGIAVTTFLAKWLQSLKDRKYTYRIVFAPETIGPIVYLSKNIKQMQDNTIAGFVITCVGDNNKYSFLSSRHENTLADKVARHVLNNFTQSYNTYSFLQRGSDERQYCHPLVDLPVVSIMRSKYGTYPEYHTSLDDLNFISPEGLNGSYNILQKCIQLIENNESYINNITCEPKLTERGLHPKGWESRHTGDHKKLRQKVLDMVNVIAYSDGDHDLVSLSEKIKINFEECLEHINLLVEKKVLTIKK